MEMLDTNWFDAPSAHPCPGGWDIADSWRVLATAAVALSPFLPFCRGWPRPLPRRGDPFSISYWSWFWVVRFRQTGRMRPTLKEGDGWQGGSTGRRTTLGSTSFFSWSGSTRTKEGGWWRGRWWAWERLETGLHSGSVRLITWRLLSRSRKSSWHNIIWCKTGWEVSEGKAGFATPGKASFQSPQVFFMKSPFAYYLHFTRSKLQWNISSNTFYYPSWIKGQLGG